MRSLCLAAALALAALPAAPARAGVPIPDLAFAAGSTFAVTGTPDGGGLSASVAATWPVADRIRVGVLGYADDIGTTLVEMRDPNDGTPIGTSADLHRWAWGAAWHADADLWSRGRWSTGATGSLGWWRVEDDQRGTNIAAASAVGFRLGLEVRRRMGLGRDLGLEVNYHRLSEEDGATWRRVGRYASAALKLRWSGRNLHD